jgi:hypothetical protein
LGAPIRAQQLTEVVEEAVEQLFCKKYLLFK